jgi:hypothetical protein
MLQTGNWQSLSTEAQSTIMEGALAYHALKHEHHDYNHWVKVGKAIVELRRAAAAEAGVSPNSLKHPAYRAAYKRLVGSEQAGELGEIDSATSTHAAWLANNLANVEAWRATLDSKARISLNHPTTIWRRHPDGRKAEQAEKRMQGEPTGRRTATRDLDHQVGRLSSLNDDIERKIGGSQLTFDWSTPEMIEESIGIVFDIYVPAYGEASARMFFERGLARLTPVAPETPLDPAFTASVKQPRASTSRRKRAAKPAKAEKPAKPPKPVIPPWCRPGKLADRVELLRQALETAGAAGLRKWRDVIPLDVSEAISDRGIAAMVRLTGSSGLGSEVDKRIYLSRFAPGAAAAHEAAADAPADEPAQAPQPQPANPVEAALRKAGDKGLSTFELMQATRLDAVGLFGMLTPLRESGHVIERDGRFYHAAAIADAGEEKPAEPVAEPRPALPLRMEQEVFAKLRAAGDKGMTGSELYLATGAYLLDLDDLVEGGRLRRDGERYLVLS